MLYPNLSISSQSQSQIQSQASQPSSIHNTSSTPDDCNSQWLLIKKSQGPVYTRIPKASREKSCRVFTKILDKVISLNDKESWDLLLNFARNGLGSSTRGGKKHTSQATLINKRLEKYASGISNEEKMPKRKPPSKPNISKQVSIKLAMGDVRGAVNLVTSKESILPPSEETKIKLQAKHPPQNSNSQSILTPDYNGILDHFKVSKDDVRWAVRGFKKGTSGGPDGLCPQHLLDKTGMLLGEPGEKLLESIADFINLVVLPGKVPIEIQATFFGANLTALLKPDGGIRPIACGLTLRRLAAKIIMAKLKSFCGKEFRPNQMGVGTPKGCEAAVHAVRCYVKNDTVQDQVLLKIDFKNAFNSVRRDVVLKLVKDKLPEIYPFVYQCYGKESNLFFGDGSFNSSKGVQ